MRTSTHLALGARLGVESSENTTQGRFSSVVIGKGVVGAGVLLKAGEGSLSSFFTFYLSSCLIVIFFFILRF
jgi:hypothetical protein